MRPHSPSTARKGGDSLQLTLQQKRGASISVGPLRRRRVQETVRLVGRTMVLAHSQGRAHSRVEGTVEAILVREGQYVQAKQELFRLYSSSVIDLQRQYVELYTRWRSSQRRLAVQETLFHQNLLSYPEINQGRSELRQVETQLRATENLLRLLGIEPDTTGRIHLLSIRAPIAGYITRIAVSIGEYVRPEQPMAYIVNLQDIHADLHISERELSWLRKGMPVLLHIPGLPQAGLLRSSIEYIAQVEDTSGRYLIVHVRVPHVPYPLFAGTPIEGMVLKDRGEHFAVPREALGYRGGQAYVFVQREETYVPLPVKVTLVDTLALIEGPGLQEGLPIVQRGAAFLSAQLWQVGPE
ncbi:MAG: efflux RND transporter periplasmic adaptor subunit [Bacteroidia bacterium]|nr:efflux RND transporter periplasmic adaptor subunit [Bacteroidia bacterium]